jgi:hypothetical protein
MRNLLSLRKLNNKIMEEEITELRRELELLKIKHENLNIEVSGFYKAFKLVNASIFILGTTTLILGIINFLK